MAKRKKPDKEEPGDVTEEAYFDVEEYRRSRASEIWNRDDTGHDLTLEERLFVRSYIIDRNPVAALKRLGYDYETPRLRLISDQYLRNTEVKGAIEVLAKRMMDQLEITAEKVQKRIASVAFFDPRQVMEFDNSGMQLLNSRFWSEEQAQNIQSVKMTKEGIEVKFYDGLRASEMLAKQLQMQPDDNMVTAEQSKAAAEAVISKIVDVFIKTRGVDPEEVDRRRIQYAERERNLLT